MEKAVYGLMPKVDNGPSMTVKEFDKKNIRIVDVFKKKRLLHNPLAPVRG